MDFLGNTQNCKHHASQPRNSIGNALSSGFGSEEYFKSKLESFGELVVNLVHENGLQTLFEELLGPSEKLRSYLGVNYNESVELEGFCFFIRQFKCRDYFLLLF